MKYEAYDTRFTDTTLSYKFYSEGPAGKIEMRVLYTPFDQNDHVYNLSFGNIDSDGELDDSRVTNNRDTEKILATVASTVQGFFELHRGKKILIVGSTKSRTRLYRMMISKYFDEWIENFQVYGLIDETFVSLEMNVNYEAFLITEKF